MSPTEPLAGTVFVLGAFPQLSQTFIHREMEALARAGHPVQVVATRRTRVPDAHLGEAMRAIRGQALYLDLASAARRACLHPRALGALARLPHRNALFRARGLAAGVVAAGLAPALAARGTRYLHAHFAGFESEIAMALSRALGVPWGATFHAYDIYQDRNLLAEKIAAARGVWTCTAANVAWLARLAPEHAAKIRLAYHGLDLGRLSPATASPAHPRRVLAVGRLVEKKGFEHLLRAAALLAERDQPVDLRIIGAGERGPRLHRLARRLGLPATIFLGAQSNAEVLAEMRAAALLAVPSIVAGDGDVDGIPNVILEAMALGRPVVASRLSGIPEVIVDGETGLLVEPGDAAPLSAALARVLDDPTLGARLGAAARARIERDFDVDRNVQPFVDWLARSTR